MRWEKYPTFGERFVQFSKSFEKAIITCILILFAALVIAQVLLQVDGFRLWFVEVERLEGVAS